MDSFYKYIKALHQWIKLEVSAEDVEKVLWAIAMQNEDKILNKILKEIRSKLSRGLADN